MGLDVESSNMKSCLSLFNQERKRAAKEHDARRKTPGYISSELADGQEKRTMVAYIAFPRGRG